METKGRPSVALAFYVLPCSLFSKVISYFRAMDKNVIETLRKLTGKRDARVLIVPHISPDGDAAGACSALWQVMDKLGVECHLMTCDYFPEYLKWLKRIPDSVSYQQHPIRCKRWLQEADVLFMLDHNTMAREGDLEPFTREYKGNVVMIDHHPDPDEVTLCVSDTRVSSTCELLYDVITSTWGKEIIDTDIANALYTGISTDTGGLNHNSSRPETYLVIARLLEAGLDKAYVHEELYQKNTLSRLRLTGNCLLNKLEVDENFPVAIIPVTLQELEKYHYKDGDLEGLVNIPLSVESVSVSVQVTERKDRVKLSFRSKGDIPVNLWAKTHFNGGGHLNAAGGQLQLPIEEVVKKLKETSGWFFGEIIKMKLSSR